MKIQLLIADAVVSYSRSKHRQKQTHLFLWEVITAGCENEYYGNCLLETRTEEFSWGSRNRAFPQGNITCFVEREATLSNERRPAFLVFLKNTLSPKHAPLRDTQLQKHREMHPNHNRCKVD